MLIIFYLLIGIFCAIVFSDLLVEEDYVLAITTWPLMLAAVFIISLTIVVKYIIKKIKNNIFKK